MKISSIDHILRSAAAITNHRTFVIVGSAAVIARLRGKIPSRMTLSDEVDIYAFDASNVEELSDLIDGSIGQDSSFHSTFGYYADGVSPKTSKMPSDWMERANKYESPEAPDVLAIVPEENDIALANAGRLAGKGHQLVERRGCSGCPLARTDDYPACAHACSRPGQRYAGYPNDEGQIAESGFAEVARRRASESFLAIGLHPLALQP